MRIDCLPALQDNYIFLLVDVEQRQAAVVDPAEAEPVLAALQAEGLTLTAILNTHHHGDHVGGNRRLLRQFPEAAVSASAVDRDRCDGRNEFLLGNVGLGAGAHWACGSEIAAAHRRCQLPRNHSQLDSQCGGNGEPAAECP